MTLIRHLSDKEWWLEEHGFEPEKTGFYETVFTVGNGYQGIRGSLEEGLKGGYPACYLGGVFDHHDSTVIDLVNAPDWLPLTVWVDGIRLNMQGCKILDHRRILDLRCGLLYRHTRYEDALGRRTGYESLRYASFNDQHLCGIHALLTAENYDAEIVVESSINAERYNLDRLPKYVGEQKFHPEVKWEKWAKSKHLQCIETTAEQDLVYLEASTIDTGHRLGYATAMELIGAQGRRSIRVDYERVTELTAFQAQMGKSYGLDKLVTIHTSRDIDGAEVKNASLAALRTARKRGFETRLLDHTESWAAKWASADCVVDGDATATHALRFNIYHLLITANEHDPKANIGAKSMSGEGYKGHVFWDTEIFMLPFFIYTQPATARALLEYRYHTMAGALENARSNGFSGAQYPWEAADTGVETTPKWTADGEHRIWTGEEEIHITSDVAYGVITYVTATGDWDFIFDYGAEILFNTARFWDSRLEYNKAEDRYELNRVIGPDEFHEHVDNNVFTNWMTQWNLQKALELHDLLQEKHTQVHGAISTKMGLTAEEVARWRSIADKIFIPFDPEKKLIEQFEGFFECQNAPIIKFDDNNMPVYPDGYDHFNAGKSNLVKQPDVVMLLYVLPDEFDDQVKQVNYEYYESKTMHKSSLSPSIHCIMGIEVGDTEKAQQYFMRSALVDLVDNQGNTEWGIH
ncbi:MAG: glycoside hydrolase family 65 protein, partial [Pseudomonadales bacterium]